MNLVALFSLLYLYSIFRRGNRISASCWSRILVIFIQLMEKSCSWWCKHHEWASLGTKVGLKWVRILHIFYGCLWHHTLISNRDRNTQSAVYLSFKSVHCVCVVVSPWALVPPSEVQLGQQKEFQCELYPGPCECQWDVWKSMFCQLDVKSQRSLDGKPDLAVGEAFQRCLSLGVCSQGQTRKCSQSVFL